MAWQQIVCFYSKIKKNFKFCKQKLTGGPEIFKKVEKVQII